MSAVNQGTNFTNLSKLIGANQNNGLGTAIQSGVQNQANKVTGDTTSAFNDFQTQANNQNLNTDQNKQYISNTLGAFGAPPTNDPNVTSQTNGGSTEIPSSTPLDQTGNAQSQAQANGAASSTPQPFSGVNAGQVSAFDTFRNGAYNGPTQLNNFNNLQAEAQTTQQLGQNTSTSGGRQQLLQQFAGGGNGYSQGEQNLDNIILGQTGAGNLTAARQATQGVANQVNQAGSNASNLAGTVAAGNKAFGDYTTQQVNNTYNPLNDALNQSVTGAQGTEATREASLQAIQSLLSKDPASFSNATTFDGAALDPNSPNYKQQLQANQLALGQQALQKLSAAGLISNTDTGAGTPNPDATSGLVPAWQGSYGTYGTYTDPTTGQFVTQKPNGQYTYNGGPQNGQQYVPPGTDPGSQQTQWSTLLGNLSNYNQSAPESVNYDQILSQAITDNQAQNVSRAGLGSQDQLAKLNALNQLAGKSQEFGLTPTTNADGTTTPTYGNYTAGNQSFDQSRALNAIQAITNPNAAPLASGAAPASAGGPNLAGQVAGNVLLGGAPIGNQILTGIGGMNNGATDAIGNVSSGVENAISGLTGGGGGGGSKIICNELHRQGYIPADIIILDEAYGVAFRRHDPETYLGYLTVARPIVRAMKMSQLVTKLVSFVAIPWSKYMAHQMNPEKCPNSIIGTCIHHFFVPILLGVHKVCKLKKSGIQITTRS